MNKSIFATARKPLAALGLTAVFAFGNAAQSAARKRRGKPVGRPYAVTEIAQRANALIEGWHLGQEGGTTVADILFGHANPGGKLPMTLARSVGQLPMFCNQKPSAHRGDIFDVTEPLFPFGFGLSYTPFDISAPQHGPAVRSGARGLRALR